jgi:hypothetical protein
VVEQLPDDLAADAPVGPGDQRDPAVRHPAPPPGLVGNGVEGSRVRR